jgi:hypothetical protein
MRDLLRRLFRNQAVFIIVNTAFWLGLAALLLTDPLRLVVGGSLMALALGGYLLYAGLFPKITRGMAQPDLARMLSIIFGLTATVFALLMLFHTFSGGASTRQQIVRDKLATAARGYTWLDLSGMGLREIPPEVWDLTHLTQLDLSDNRLEVLPPEIARLANLERLYLDGNRLEALPPEIGQLSHLEWLDLDGNRLMTLPPEFARLQSLTHLQIQYNRWETFPGVILELPNLELLFLAGNRLGELPQSITQRAETGELNLWYKPDASRVDWTSISVIGFTFVLPVLMSWGVDRWWTRREFEQRQAARQTGEIFAIPPMMRSPTLFVIFALSAVSLFMLIAALNGPQTGVTMEAGVGLCLLFSPLIVGGLIFLLHNTGMVVLTAEGVTLHRPLRRKSVRYAEIVAVTSQSRVFAPGILIRGQERTLRISRMLENLPRLYTLLLQRVSPAVRDAALGKTLTTSVAPAADDDPVYAFAIHRRAWTLYIVGTVLFVVIYLGIGLMGLWIGLARGDVPPFTARWARDTAITFLLVSTFFLPALIFIVRSIFTEYGPFETKQPGALELYQDKIRYRFPRSLWHEYPARDLRRVTLQSLPFTVRTRAAGAIIEQQMTRYMLFLEFADDVRLVIDQERAVQFGQTPERLYAMLTQLYGK